MTGYGTRSRWSGPMSVTPRSSSACALSPSRAGVVTHQRLVVRSHPGHRHQPAGEHLRRRDARHRSPTPDAPHLDPAPPTSSYPSSHIGASVALYASLAIMATTIKRAWLRRTVIAVCSLIPVLVAYARLYRGMHHLSDVVIGAINGLVCAALAAHCLLHRRRLPASDS